MTDWLDKIVSARKKSLSKAIQRRSVQELEDLIISLPKPPSFSRGISEMGRISLIAEIKRKSPSAGLIRDTYDVTILAGAYKKGGAKALSVLTEPDYFGGAIEDVRSVQKASDLPVLRKDFIFDPYQVIEARAFGASALLLIADMIEAKLLIDLANLCREVDIEPLVEVFSRESIDAALKTGAVMVGINTRNLRTLEMNPNQVAELRPLIPKDKIVIAESGIKSPQDVTALKAQGVSAILVGESLLKQPNLSAAAKVLVEAGGS